MMMLTLPLVFAALLCLGLPIAFVLGITALVMIALYSPSPLMMVPEIMYNSLDTFPLMAIPFFVLAAQFMVRGGVSKYLIEAANCYIGHVRGGLAIVAVVSCMLFAAICGSSVATALAIGVIVIPAMMKYGYPRSFAAGVVAASGTMGIMIPPSIALIIYGIIAEENIPRLFLAGFMPGLMEGGFYIAWIAYYSRRKGFGGGHPRATLGQTLNATWKAIPAYSLPVIILGGIYSGFVTVTEAAALAAVVSILISLFIYGGVRLREIIPISAEAMKGAGMIMFIITTAIVFGNWMTEAGFPAKVVSLAKDLQLSAFTFLLFINIILLILGMFLEVVSIMLITLPIMLPIVHQLGIDPVHFGIIVTVNMELALETPPVGLNLYVISGVAKSPLWETIKGTFPFTCLGLIQLAIITYWPAYTLFLPNLLMPR
jgi:C4-dicarboxylate transporter DctM subunit